MVLGVSNKLQSEGSTHPYILSATPWPASTRTQRSGKTLERVGRIFALLEGVVAVEHRCNAKSTDYLDCLEAAHGLAEFFSFSRSLLTEERKGEFS